MGLDAVEFVMALESSFDIVITDAVRPRRWSHRAMWSTTLVARLLLSWKIAG